MNTGVRGKWVFDSELEKLVEVVPQTIIQAVPAIHQDTIVPLQHPATGEFFDSKSAFRRVTKERGYIEIDDDKTWNQIGEKREILPEGFKEDFEEIKHWYAEAMRGNRDYINANVPPEWRDCEEENPDDITQGIRR